MNISLAQYAHESDSRKKQDSWMNQDKWDVINYVRTEMSLKQKVREVYVAG